MIVKATIDQIPVIQELAKKSWETTYYNILSKEQLEYMLQMMYSESVLKTHFNHPNYLYYLIRDQDVFLGFIGIEFHYEDKTTKLHRIYFIEEAQGKGLGKKALEFIKLETQKQGDNRIVLTVNKNNKAKNFYIKQGFCVYDEAVFDIGNGFVMDDYLMEWVL